MEKESLSGALAENLLTLLCFDDKYGKLVRHSITPSLFESSVFREIATQACDFIDQFNGETIKEHISDSLEGILEGDDKKKATSYRRVLDNLFLAKDSINGDYVVSKVHEFVRQQNLKSAIVKAVESVEAGNIAQAEIDLTRGLKSQSVTFDLGTRFSDPKQALAFFDIQNDGIQTGISEFDKRDICPRPGEMFLFIAPAKMGKSWALIHMGKFAMLQRKKVLHVTLEMSEARVSQRYVQSFFSVAKREAVVQIPKFEVDTHGHLLSFDMNKITRPTLLDPKIKTSLTKKINQEFKNRPPLVIKQFPTRALTMSALEAYLDGLERFHKFIPDVLIIDYPDLMMIKSDNLRVDTGNAFRELRGLGVERNMAIITATQGNRSSSTAKVVTDAMVSEDYSKIATADIVVTYSRTAQEKALGLARLYVSNGRNDEDKFQVLISQSYHIGQFCLESAMMLGDYFDQVEIKAEEYKPRKDE